MTWMDWRERVASREFSKADCGYDTAHGRAFLVRILAWKISTCYSLVFYGVAEGHCSWLLQEKGRAEEAERIVKEEGNVVERAATLVVKKDRILWMALEDQKSLGSKVRTAWCT